MSDQNETVATPATPATPAVTHPVTVENVSKVLSAIIIEGPQVIAEFDALAPYAALLPAPFNAIANPVVVKAVDLFPKSFPILSRIQAILDSIAVPVNSNPNQS